MFNHWQLGLETPAGIRQFVPQVGALFFFDSDLPRTWQVSRLGDKKLPLTVTLWANDSSCHCMDCVPGTDLSLVNSHNALKADAQLHSVNEAMSSETWRDRLKAHSSDSGLPGFQNLLHHKSSLCPSSLRPWLPAPLAVCFPCGLQSRDPGEQLLSNSPFKMPQFWNSTSVYEHLWDLIRLSACLNFHVLKIWFLVTTRVGHTMEKWKGAFRLPYF